ncbi:hypothetical protein [Micromonospora zhanjiangensis]|uniref:Excreted virulence factor EspC, type VII ESX diderm n=1 Tax=Micromonospora zhanjiangensis TaxID=1522057 RepID=A0ABV8KI50_9ACTN
MSIEDVKATIRRGNRAVKESRGTLERANTRLLDATRAALPALAGSEHPEVQRARAGFAESAREIELTLRRLGAAAEHGADYLTTIG